jgi:hypothetical protein
MQKNALKRYRAVIKLKESLMTLGSIEQRKLDDDFTQKNAIVWPKN